MVSLSLVVPTLDRAEALYNLLRHLEHQTLQPDEIVVVDQSAREDGRIRDLVRSRPSIRFHRIPVPGLPNARNVGVSLSRGEVVLFLDDDSIPDPGLVKAHAERYGDPSVAGVGGRVSGGYDRASGPVGRFNPRSGTVLRNFGAGVVCDVDHLPGGNMSFRREVFAAVGGFDVAFGGSAIGEETDFCLRARRAGFRLVFEPAAAVDHLHWPTGGCRAPRMEDWLYWHAHNAMLFALRHARAAAWPLFILRRIVRFAMMAASRGSLPLLVVGLHGLVRGASAHRAGRA